MIMLQRLLLLLLLPAWRHENGAACLGNDHG